MMNQYMGSIEEREKSSGRHAGHTLLSTPGLDTSIMKRKSKMDTLHKATEEGKALRLKLLSGSVIVFINSGYKGKRFIYEKARDLGVVSIMIDSPGSWSEALVEEGILHKFIPIDLGAVDVKSQIVAAINGLADEGLAADGVMTFWETAVPLASAVAELLDLPGNPLKAIEAAKNKHETRRLMAVAGLPTPRNTLIESKDELKKAADHVGFPAVLKPIEGLLSIGVVRVNDLQHLIKTYTEVTDLMDGMYMSRDGQMGQVPKGSSLPKGAAMLKCQMMLEEYLDGVEVDVDVVMSGRKAVYCKVTDNWPTMEPWFNETGDNSPSVLPENQQYDLSKLCVGTLLALGLKMGVYHVEAKMTSRGPRLIEVNCRMGGGQVRDNNLAVWGVDLVDESLLAAIGLPNAPPVPAKPFTCRSALYFNAMRSGVMGAGDWLSEIRTFPGVVYAKLLVKEGDHVTCSLDGLPTWIGQIMCDGETPKEAIDLVKKYEEMVSPPIETPSSALSSLKCAPPLDMEADIDRALLAMCSQEGQAYRLSLLNERVIVFISAGYPGKKFIFEKARDLGVKSFVIDNPGSWSSELEGQGVITRFIPVVMEAETVVEQIVAAITGLAGEGYLPSGVMTFWETSVPLAARVAEALGIKGNTSNAIDAAKNKFETRRLMAEAGLPTPRNVLLTSKEDLPAAAQAVGFPAVIKPINGLLSIGVVRVSDAESLTKVFCETEDLMNDLYLTKDGHMEKISETGSLPEGAHPLKCQMMLEEYLDGTEVDIDVVLSSSKAMYCKVTDNWPTLEPWFNETGDNAPSMLPADNVKELEELAEGTLQCLGFSTGVFHVEAKLTSRGPRLIEVNSRMGGGQVRENNRAVWGVDLVDEALMAAVGMPNAPVVPETAFTCRSALYFNSPKTGVMGSGDWLADIRSLPGVVYAKLMVSEGEHVTCAEDGLPTWLGQLMCNGSTPQEAVDLVTKYADMVSPPVFKFRAKLPCFGSGEPVSSSPAATSMLSSTPPVASAMITPVVTVAPTPAPIPAPSPALVPAPVLEQKTMKKSASGTAGGLSSAFGKKATISDDAPSTANAANTANLDNSWGGNATYK